MKSRPLDRSEVLDRLRVHLSEVGARYDVRSLSLFGSYAKGTPRKASDVDLLVEFSQTPSLLKLIELEQYLSDILGIKVDLVMNEALKPSIRQRIASHVIPV